MTDVVFFYNTMHSFIRTFIVSDLAVRWMLGQEEKNRSIDTCLQVDLVVSASLK